MGARFSWTQNQVTRRCAICAFFGGRVVCAGPPGGSFVVVALIEPPSPRGAGPALRVTAFSVLCHHFGAKKISFFPNLTAPSKVVTRKSGAAGLHSCHREPGDTLIFPVRFGAGPPSVSPGSR